MSTPGSQLTVRRHESEPQINDSLKDKTLTANGNFGWTFDYAAAFVYNRLEESITDAYQALVQTRNLHCRRDDMVFRIFDKLDGCLFAEKLKHNVYLEWASLDSGVSGRTSIAGVVAPRVSVQLNEDVHLNASREDIIASLIHHMIHAYFLVCCGPAAKHDPDDKRLKHGKRFGLVLYKIRDISGYGYRRHLPLHFGHDLLVGSEYWKEDYNIWDPYHRLSWSAQSSPSPLNDVNEHGCSDCSAHIIPFSRRKCKHWYYETGMKALESKQLEKLGEFVYDIGDKCTVSIPRPKAGPPEDFIELLWQPSNDASPRRIKTDRAKTTAFASLAPRFANGIRELALPPLSFAYLKHLHHFITTSTYGPNLSKVQDGTTGPPRILDVQKDAPQYLATDIAMFKVGDALGFKELLAHALQRLQDQHFAHEDVLAALADLYSDSGSDGPHADLRAWALAFLTRRAGEAIDSANLTILQLQHDALAALVDKSAAFKADVAKAADALAPHSHQLLACSATPPPPPPLPPSVAMARAPLPPAPFWAREYPKHAAYDFLMRRGARPPSPPGVHVRSVAHADGVGPQWLPPRVDAAGRWTTVEPATGVELVWVERAGPGVGGGFWTPVCGIW
ncbi:hypothetical protein B0A49_07502 [Cryomyces minteri]|uniref:Uncharacterized protein n=1 Tax=Cryomyces minteri TaxID=331657 RepID=A0A4U0X667_9PEZI|nr:hypothetical protein B0A49_07502 [Cryomyces minteri]